MAYNNREKSFFKLLITYMIPYPCTRVENMVQRSLA